MSIFVKAIHYQQQAAAFNADSACAAIRLQVAEAKNKLRDAFRAVISSPYAAELMVVTAKTMDVPKKAAKIFRNLTSNLDLRKEILDANGQSLIRLPISALPLALKVLLAETELQNALQKFPPLYQSYRKAKNELQDAVFEERQLGKTAEKIIRETKQDAYRAEDTKLSYRTLDKIEEWGSEEIAVTKI